MRRKRMQKSVALRSELQRCARAAPTPSLLDHIQVDYYGTETPLSQVANVTSADPRTLSDLALGQEHGAGHREGDHDVRISA